MSVALRAEEVAQRLGTSTDRVYNLIRIKAIPAFRIGRQVRVLDTALDAWIAAGGYRLEGGWKKEG